MLALAVAGCGPAVIEPQGGTESASATGSSTGEPSTDTSTSTPAAGSSVDSTGVTTPMVDAFGQSCSTPLQDCPAGFKCAPFAAGGEDFWNDARCLPVVDRPMHLGEPCQIESSRTSGIDNCDIGLTCSYAHPDTLDGTCVEQCLGDVWAWPLECSAPGAECTMPHGDDGVSFHCFVPCDPLAQSCGAGQACAYVYFGPFSCVPSPDWLPGYGEECSPPTRWCGAGLFCASSNLLANCTGGSCCTNYCDAASQSACADPGESCVSLDALGWLLGPGYADVGLCVIP